MDKFSFFKVGETYTNDQIRFSLQNLGGIRPALDAKGRVRHVAILTACEDSGRLRAENPYHDRIDWPRTDGREHIKVPDVHNGIRAM